MIIAVILAGGVSKRFSINKLFYPLKGKPLIRHVIDNIKSCRYVLKTVIVSSPFNEFLFEDLDTDIVIDNMCIGPLGGIYLALKLFGKVIIFGGDMPNICCGFIEKMIHMCIDDIYACIPTWSSGYMEPLSAIYTYKLIPILEYGIAIGEYSIQRLIKKLNFKVQLVDIEKHLSDFLYVFNNINTVEDIHKLVGYEHTALRNNI